MQCKGFPDPPLAHLRHEEVHERPQFHQICIAVKGRQDLT